MRKRQKQVSGKDLLMGREIPNDIITEILLRLPAKSIARIRCLSKQWASILHRPHFTEMFLTFSSARPLLLFALKVKGEWFFFSARQPLSPDKNSPPSLVVDHHKPCSRYFTNKICSPVHGLICTNSWKPMICNPSTGECIPLPKPTLVGNAYERTFCGYDPINKLFKVLSLDDGGCRVLTLGLVQLSWRTIECSIPQLPVLSVNEICIDGVLYYLAYCHGKKYPDPCMVVCFDVRLETFKFLSIDTDSYQIGNKTLINCKGRLGVLPEHYPNLRNNRIELLVLDDADEQKWSKHIYLPPLSINYLYVVGMTRIGEIVYSSRYTRLDFSIFYYDVEHNTMERVKIDLGIPCMFQRIYIFLDHMENVKIMQPNA